MTLARTLLIGAAVAGVMTTGAQAADLYRTTPGPVSSFYDDPVSFAFEGFYAGILGGAVFAGGIGGTVGGAAGVNFAVSDMFFVGAEAQASAWFTGGGLVGFDALGLAHLGVLLTDNMMVYAAGGGGVIAGGPTPVYALGGGVEFAVSDAISLRGEALALGTWGAPPTIGKLQAGLLFHIN